MSEPDRTVVQQFVREEIRRIVADTIAHPGIVRTVPLAELIARAYPNSGMSRHEIADEISRAAIKAGVPLELGKRTA